MPPEERVLEGFDEQAAGLSGREIARHRASSSPPRTRSSRPPSRTRWRMSSCRCRAAPSSIPIPRPAAGWSRRSPICARRFATPRRRSPNYRASSDLLLTGETGGTFADQATERYLHRACPRARRTANAEARAENVRAALASGRAVDTLNDVVASPMIQRLKETRIQRPRPDRRSLHDPARRSSAAEGPEFPACRVSARRSVRKRRRSWQPRKRGQCRRLRERQLVAQLNTLKATSRQGRRGRGRSARRWSGKRPRSGSCSKPIWRATARRPPAAARMRAPADARIISQAVEPTERHFPKVLPITIVAALSRASWSELRRHHALRTVQRPRPPPGRTRRTSQTRRGAAGSAVDRERTRDGRRARCEAGRRSLPETAPA